MANQWLTGSGVPSTGIGQVTDYYRDTVSNLVYYRENAFTWVVVPAFTPSPDGIGTTWLHGNVPPLTGQGSDGDYYYDEVQLIVYRKDVATWVPKGSLDFIGLYGVQWGNGLGAPASTVPLNALPAGSFYLDVVTSDIYYKGPSMSWELKGQLGDGGGGGGGSPINLITTIEEVAELDVTSAVTPSVIYDLDLLKADLASPVFTGAPTAPTPQTEPSLDNSTKLATTEFVNVVADAAVSTANSYADSLLTSVYKFQSTYNPQTTGNFPTTANTVGGVDIAKCFTWVIAGLSGQYTFQGVTVDNGDTLLSLVDNASATVSSDWHITEKNLGYTPENVNNKATNLTLPDDTKYPTTQAVVTALDGYEPELPANVGSVKFLREDRTWQTAPAPVLTEANFSVAQTGQPTYTVSWVLTALTAAQLWTVPDKAINFGDLSSIATTNSNTLGGTRTRILGGSHNNVSGTDNVVVTGSNNTLSASGQVVLTGDFISEVTWNFAVITAAMADSATYRKTVAVTTALTGTTLWGSHLSTACTTGGLYSATTVPKSYLSVYGDVGGSETFSTIGIHTLTIIGRTANTGGSTIGSANRFVGKRRVVVNNTGGTVTVSITTEGTDYNPAGAVTMNISNDSGKLMIAPFFTSESADFTSSTWNVLVESVYTTL